MRQNRVGQAAPHPTPIASRREACPLGALDRREDRAPHLVVAAKDPVRMSAPLDAAPFRLPSAPFETDLVAKYFRGLGDPIRLRILELLRREGELSVGELVGRLRLPQPQVSNHLACLRWCGFVETRRLGRTVLNRIADERVATMLDLGRSLLADNAVHVAACCQIEGVER
jgi:DNA-binding transcriptional ArsR family regulator